MNLFISLSFLLDPATEMNVSRDDFRWGYPWRLEDVNTAFLAAWKSTIFFSTASSDQRNAVSDVTSSQQDDRYRHHLASSVSNPPLEDERDSNVDTHRKDQRLGEFEARRRSNQDGPPADCECRTDEDGSVDPGVGGSEETLTKKPSRRTGRRR